MSFVQLVDFDSEDADQQFTQSLRKSGFAVLKNHPIDLKLIQDVYDGWYQYYQTDDKYEFPYDPVANIGFQGPEKSETAKGYAIKDCKEFFHYRAGQVCPAHLTSITHQLF